MKKLLMIATMLVSTPIMAKEFTWDDVWTVVDQIEIVLDNDNYDLGCTLYREIEKVVIELNERQEFVTETEQNILDRISRIKGLTCDIAGEEEYELPPVDYINPELGYDV